MEFVRHWVFGSFLPNRLGAHCIGDFTKHSHALIQQNREVQDMLWSSTNYSPLAVLTTNRNFDLLSTWKSSPMTLFCWIRGWECLVKSPMQLPDSCLSKIFFSIQVQAPSIVETIGRCLNFLKVLFSDSAMLDVVIPNRGTGKWDIA